MNYEIIIIGGSYAGLSAATTLGRALRKVLVIDGGKPCNRQTPHSHNFLTRDGETPATIANIAKDQLTRYKTVKFVHDFAIDAARQKRGFEVLTLSGKIYTASRLLFATGITDAIPDILGFAECWGISVLHCPYCHGYEVSYQPTGVIGNGDGGFEMAKLISNWTKDLTLFTNGEPTLTAAQLQKLKSKKIKIIDSEVQAIAHHNGQVKSIALAGNLNHDINVLYARVPFAQHCNLPQQLGCQLTDMGYMAVDGFYQTSVPGIYAAGDNITPMRSVALAVSGGVSAGAFINKDLIDNAYI
ncbi:NAD(P)/FAD-dependent oxidoreductase [Mucilaginibacter sp. SP1R1]|uniref:NAD(P)/FAD-dependent oxidoreductase n=1 Tax=Mucilaginibacter sp. SP1R1 TaxID=2723091 RepID=UPI001619EAD3|nr:NAD(P)/FAD-dependent oxidoreductase [Mucilaginibacter sp. SP1R1]MBB6151486.1 thioredoxin reductase [Mucilaginibacter sp. SP1R1]